MPSFIPSIETGTQLTATSFMGEVLMIPANFAGGEENKKCITGGTVLFGFSFDLPRQSMCGVWCGWGGGCWLEP